MNNEFASWLIDYARSKAAEDMDCERTAADRREFIEEFLQEFECEFDNAFGTYEDMYETDDDDDDDDE